MAQAAAPEHTTEIIPLIVNRIVIVIGTTGTDKSTIINMLYNNDTTRYACNKPYNVGDGVKAVTQRSSVLSRSSGLRSFRIAHNCAVS